MLQLLHKYQKSVLLIFTIVVLTVAMISFGMTPYASNPQAGFALKINDEEISQQQFLIAKSNLENNYRQQFGDFYQQLIEMGGLNLQEQTIDRLIEETLLTQFSKQQDLVVSYKDIQKALFQVFGADFSKEKYQEFLLNTRQTAGNFEARLAKELTPSVLMETINDHLNLSNSEIEYSVKQEETAYKYQAFVFDPAKVVSEVALPNDQELALFYEDRAADYETPEKIKYQAIAFKPEENLALVEVSPEDIEIYYSENTEKYSTADKILARSIVIKKDLNNIIADQTNKTQAEDLVAKIDQGEDFEKLAKAHSADSKSHQQTWIEKGTKSEKFDQAAFDLSAMGSPKLVETENEYLIIRVEDFQEGKIKSLEEVSAEIKELLQKRDVDAYLQVKAEDLYANWQNSEKSLSQLAEEEKISNILETNEAKAQNEDLEEATGLTKLVLEQQDLPKQIHEINGVYYLVEVKEVVPSKIPLLEEIKEKVVADYQNEMSVELAKKKAEEFLAKVKDNTADIEAISKDFQVETLARDGIKKNSQEEELMNSEIQKAILAQTENSLINNVFEHQNNKFYVINIQSVTPPTAEVLKAKIGEQKEKLRTGVQAIFMRSLVGQLKAQAKIEISPSLIS